MNKSFLKQGKKLFFLQIRVCSCFYDNDISSLTPHHAPAKQKITHAAPAAICALQG